ncbi:DUF1016 N-terminal domain-containing protein [Haloimpatiens lingqiaonensis]|uniref:DUF1016 N-terminal domain-containing protein n=1 Tax=Haloimpatiens lingqiaonensis TaxID=1380675 RepID=UPI00148589FD|nr:DUF1016 N-terminal domain-containing protein [Haloimpatiens lingqiaonensis]
MSSKKIENEELRVKNLSNNKLLTDIIYENIKNTLDEARAKAYSSVNFYMVQAYWTIGKIINETQDGSERAEYGKELINELSKKLTGEYGKGFDKSNLSRMRKFYVLFNNVDAVRQELSWTHYILLLKVTAMTPADCA